MANVYAGGGLDRLVERRRDEAWLDAVLHDQRTRFLVGHGGLLPVRDTAQGPVLAAVTAETFEAQAIGVPVLLGAVDGVVYVGAEGETGGTGEQPPGARFADLRDVGPLLPTVEATLAATLRGLLLWHDAERHCARCGALTQPADAGHALRCTNPACGISHHPRIEPAAITLVVEGHERCLLGRSRRHPPGMHSCFAGFVEPGESLEDAARREVFEEVGVRLAGLHFHSSQPWPFPGQLMVGFVGEAATSEVRIDDNEIREARWFTRDELLSSPEDETLRLPRADSVARRLVDDWLHGRV